ncbi:hypothetical protein [Methylogaea oryzae]|uniref:Uncharacterized protein n=1 Tax=Methylogaea oryzae TaxID=1295382 RepID=A0A8D5AJ51_9GAMM|nr:hypothetical protein [Methylogaea oryzae]BBL72041.1 hypothetical protein MoryE10_26470 [Methylogaea oryzae]
MSSLKRSPKNAVASVFSLLPNSDYSRFVPQQGAEGMMLETWTAIGERLEKATATVGQEAHGKKKATTQAHI